ncbi:MAG: LysR family transcriptional regulator [Pseudomonadota bacterium]
MSVSLRQLELLHAILQEGTMSGAARLLRISQPAVSRGVAAAEQTLRVRLFDRSGGTLTPTAELDEMRPVLGLIFQQVKVARDLGGQLRYGAGRQIDLATTPCFAFGLVPRAVGRFRDDFPAAEVRARMRDAVAIKAAVLTREVDLGLVYNVTWTGPLDSAPLRPVELVCLMPTDHPLATREAVGPRDLAGTPLISFSRSSNIGLALDRLFDQAGGHRELAVATGNSFMAAGFVSAGIGLALTDPFVMETPFAQGLAARPFYPTHALTPHVVWATGRTLSAPEERLVEQLREGAAWPDSAAGRRLVQ